MVRSGGSLRPDELPKRQKALRQISVSECEFSKAVDKVYLIRTGTALGDIHVAGRLSQTSCLLHPDGSPLLKKISTRSDRHLPEDLLLLREFCLYLKRQFLRKKYKNMKFLYVKSLYFRCMSKIKKFRTKIPDLGTFFVRNSSFLDYLHQTNFPFIKQKRHTRVCLFLSYHPIINLSSERQLLLRSLRSSFPCLRQLRSEQP